MNFNNNDNPITNIEEDILGFKSLAKRIATSITNSNIDTTSSFTISIEGQWGSGKTSLVNLIKNDIKDKVVVMEFNPWIVNDFEQLVAYFFSELLKEIIHESFDAKLKEDIWKDIKTFVEFFTPNRVSIGVSDTKITYNVKDTLFNKDEKTLLELKSKINNYLKKLDKKIVIIVDDIDRLTDTETETFFRLIKGIADFDNLIYVLLYDKAIVSKSLEQFKQENGEKYLDKIVQYSISIPKIYNSVLNKILFEKLDKIKKCNFNKAKWNEVVSILDKYITNIRDINKIVSVISFEYPQIAEDVEFTDFFILSLIKVQKYELYEAIRDKQYELFYIGNIILLNNEEKKELKQKEKEFLENFLSPFSNYKPLFYELFPTFKDREYADFGRISVHQHKPIDNKHYFDNYFTFSVADNKISSQEYQALSKKLFLSDFQEFEKAILTIDNVDKVLLFLEIFKDKDKKKTIKSTDDSKNVIINFLTVHNKLPISTYWSSYPCFNIAKDIFEKLAKSESILQAIYLQKNNISLETKILFYKEIKKLYNYEIKFDKKVINQVENKLIKDLKLVKLSHLIEKKKSLNTISSIYFLISAYKLLNLSVEPLLSEIGTIIFKSRNDFFNILILFKSTNSVISSANINKYTNLNVEKIEEYINKLDKDTFTSKELEIFKAWEFRNEY